MSKDDAANTEKAGAGPTATDVPKDKVDRREIKGGIPYSIAPGVLKKHLILL